MNKPRLSSAFLLLAIVALSACSSGDGGGSASPSTPTVPYCSNVTNYSAPITITGAATYEFRVNGNGVVGVPSPIRRAEIRVTNSSGSIIQCGETDATGNFSLNLPNDDSTVNITITSRAKNAFVNAYVLNNPTDNDFYGITTPVTLDGSKAIGTITATATGAIIPGGAFNILDKILDANEYLRTETNNCSATYTNCPEFTVAPHVDVYWTRGVDPGTYFGIPSLSFYVPETNDLYILGGIGGDVDNTDTDHFDTSIILHEYAHVLENLLSIPDSPGGSHNGDNILDPRLAWGEGWANFLQAAITGNFVYRDTFGTPLGTPGLFVNEDLDVGVTDSSSQADEGNFREFSISRALVDLVDPDEMNATDDQENRFPEIWTLFASTIDGFANPNFSFRSLGLFYELQASLAGNTNWSVIQNAEQQLAARTHYANTLSNGTACPTSLLAEDVPGANPLNDPGRQPEDGSFENSNQFESNDFYLVPHSGGALNIVMSYTTTPGNAGNLDTFLYREGYSFGSASTDDLAGSSQDVINIAASGDTETISISSLAAGNYLLNVKYNTTFGIRTAGNYSITINGQSKCPD